MDRLDAVAAFVAVADTGAFVTAARRLGRSPTAVTRAIAGLEARLGARLFHRTTRAVGLTAAGHRHLELARQLLQALAAMESTAAAARSTPAGRLTVGASVVFGRLHVQPLVTEFLRRHPAVDVRLTLSDHVVSVVGESIDVAIRLGTLRDSRLKAIRVGTVRRGVYGSPSYLAAHGAPVQPGDLIRHSCIAFTGQTPNPTRWTFGSRGARFAVPVHPRLTVDLADPAIDAAVGGFGLTCVLSYMVDHLVAAGSLRAVLVEFEPPSVPVHVVHAAGRGAASLTRRFVEHAVAGLRRALGG